LDALIALESRAFAYDRLARRSFTHLLHADSSSLTVAETNGVLSGYALVLFRRHSKIARLYSLAVHPENEGRALGSALLSAAEQAAVRRRASAMRLEVKPGNQRAMKLYWKSGYRQIAELGGYYGDGSSALRLEKALAA
jgi:ribosomal protein S18 acetylase RimI-like enzyme